MNNPYQPPKTDQPAPPKQTAGPGVCPQCHVSDFTKLKFTWWGGALGPRMLSHVKCNGCGSTFNEKTGQPNTTNIIIYSVVISVILIGVLVAVRMT
jgi:transposase-like protein